jgi:hypothetical protein
MKKIKYLVLLIMLVFSPSQVFATSATVQGTITYSGVQTGQVYVAALPSPCDSGATPVQQTGPLSLVGSSVDYSLGGLAFNNVTYWICAYLDANGSGPNGPDGGDPVGGYSGNPLTISSPDTISNINLSLSDAPLNSIYTTAVPTVDGNYYSTPDEWPSNTSDAALEITSPIHTLVFIKNDSSSLYMMVNAASVSGDYTEDNDDHCTVYIYKNGRGLRVTVFGDGTKYCESTNSVSSPLLWNTIPCPAGVMAADGFGPSPEKLAFHRMYEFSLPFSAIGAVPGDIIYFASPYDLINSLPFDYNGGSPRFNIWPPAATTDELSTWGQIQLERGTFSVPSFNEWGILMFVILAGTGAVYYLRRQRRAER